MTSLNSDKTLYIIDGSSYIFRAFYALPPLRNSKGIPTGAAYGYTQMLLKLLKDKNPKYLVVVFDAKEPSFRKEIYADYKINRVSPPEDLIPQFQSIRDITRALNIPQLEKPGFEADDIIATLAKQTASDCPIIIVSSDKDLMQLIDDRIQLYDTMKEKVYDAPAVQEKLGITPAQVQDYLALAGDTSDNIPGVPNVGPKTAAQLLQKYHSLENLYQNIDEIPGKKGENLKAHREEAFLSQKLTALETRIPLSVTLEDFAIQEADQSACQKIFRELEFSQLIKTPESAPQRKSDYSLIQSDAELDELIQNLKQAQVFAFDTETTSLNTFEAKLVGLSFAWATGKACYLPLRHQTGESQLDFDQSLQKLKPIFEDVKIRKYAQNYKYDACMLKNHGVEVKGLACDTLLASYLLDPAASNKLDNLAQRYLNYKMISYDEVTKKKGGDFSLVDLKEACEYSSEDADITFQLAEIFLQKIKEDGLEKLLVDLEQPLSEVLLKMEQVGIKVDCDFLKKLQHEFETRLRETEAKIYDFAGETFNIQSPKQLGVLLFEKLQLKTIKKTKTGYSTDVEVLTQLSEIHPLPKEILNFRALAKLKSTYVDALLLKAGAQDHRVHTNFNQTVAETGRLSSTDPNLQNIPIRSEDGAKIRKAFIADSGFTLMSADYSQIELRILAEFSQDPILIQAFQNEEDVHRLTAAKIFGIDPAEITNHQRAAGKTLNFSVVYGQTPFGLSGQLGVSQKEARHYIDQYFLKYQGVAQYREKILEDARQNLCVRTLLGRRRFCPDILSKNPNMRNMAERMAFNTVIQGSAADIIKLAMIRLDQEIEKKKLRSKPLLQVHDELVFEIANSEEALMKELIPECMEKVVNFKVPLRVDVGEGRSWAEAHG